VVTGNTVIDALLWARERRREPGSLLLAELDKHAGPVLLVTTHRRDSSGDAIREVGQAVADISRARPDLVVVLQVHPNPIVRQQLLPPLEVLANVKVVEPVSYGTFVHLMALSTVILTDSGGIQGEAPSLGKPVLAMRETTERPEAVRAGTVRLVGTDRSTVGESVLCLLRDPDAYETMAKAVNPYGDRSAAARVTRSISRFLGQEAVAEEGSE
jgi:UDP-N-acetylglucosamine 2-epimerase (non-hydrolysing)